MVDFVLSVFESLHLNYFAATGLLHASLIVKRSIKQQGCYVLITNTGRLWFCPFCSRSIYYLHRHKILLTLILSLHISSQHYSTIILIPETLRGVYTCSNLSIPVPPQASVPPLHRNLSLLLSEWVWLCNPPLSMKPKKERRGDEEVWRNISKLVICECESVCVEWNCRTEVICKCRNTSENNWAFAAWGEEA